MKLICMRPAIASMLAGAMLAAAPGAAIAESLAGQIGKKRYPVQFHPGMTGPCQKVYKAYIAAPGHSAYAQTPLRYGVEAFFCGKAFNAPSQKAAEERALENCRSVGKKYKVKIAGSCAVYVSK
jgi:hypothetical protein